MTDETHYPYEISTSPMIPAEGHNPRLARQLARIVGIFGSRGHAEVAVKRDDGTVEIRAASDEIDSKIRYARKLLREYNLEPITQ